MKGYDVSTLRSAACDSVNESRYYIILYLLKYENTHTAYILNWIKIAFVFFYSCACFSVVLIVVSSFIVNELLYFTTFFYKNVVKYKKNLLQD